MKNSSFKKGFTIVEVMIVALIVVLVGVVGYLLVNNLVLNGSNSAETDTLNTQADSLTEASAVNNATDLNSVIDEVDELNLDSASSSDSSLLSSEASNL